MHGLSCEGESKPGMKNARTAILFLSLGIFLSACSGLSTQQQRALSGGAIGAAGGAVIGTVIGAGPVAGAAVGGATGAAVGALTGHR
jgi:hypothetical protein